MKKFKTIFLTVLLLSAISLTNIPESHSKYIKNNEEAITYKNIISKVNDTTKIIPSIDDSKTTYQTAKFSFTFYRSNIWSTSDTKEAYTISLSSGCSIDSVTSKGTYSNNVITYLQAPSEIEADNKSTIYYTCNVTDIVKTVSDTDFIYNEIHINETFNDTESYSNYLEGSYQQLKSKFDEKHPEPVNSKIDGNTLTIYSTETNPYSAFKTFINNYISNNATTYSIEINKYISTVFPETDSNNASFDPNSNMRDTSKTLKGLNIIYNSTDDSYSYTIDDNFKDYALTYYANSNKGENVTYSKMYFNNTYTNSTNMETMFEDYLNTYYSTDKDTILAYVNSVSSNTGIYYVVNNKISGITFSAIDNSIKINNNIKTIIENYNSGILKIAFASTMNMNTAFTNNLSSMYNFVTSTSPSGWGLRSIVTRNNTSSTSKYSFNYYVIKQDYNSAKTAGNGWFILLHIYSDYDATSDETIAATSYNYVKAYKIGTTSTMTSTYNETTKVFVVTITDTNSINIDDCVNTITNALGVTPTITSTSTTTDGITTYTYTITYTLS